MFFLVLALLVSAGASRAQFDPPRAINSNYNGDKNTDNEMHLAGGANGTWIAVWGSQGPNSLDPRGSDMATGNSLNEDVYFSRSLDNGRTWSAMKQLKANAAADHFDDINSNLTTDGQGHWMAVWRSHDPLNNTIGFDADILASYSGDDGLTWSMPVAVNQYANSDPGGDVDTSSNCADCYPRVCTDGKGRWMVGWVAYDNRKGSWETYARVAVSSDAGQHWSAAYDLSVCRTGSMYDLDAPVLATDSQGRWVALWAARYSIGTDGDLFFSFSANNGGSWSAPARLTASMATDDGDDGYPALACDGQGRWIAVWASTATLGNQLGTDFDILYARSTDNGVTWGSPSWVNADAVNDTGFNRDISPWVVRDADGSWIVLWNSNRLGGDWDIFYSMLGVGRSVWPAPQPIVPWAATDNDYDAIGGLSVDAKGHWMLGWTSSRDLGVASPVHDHDIYSMYCYLTPNAGPQLLTDAGSLSYRKGSGYEVDVTKNEPPTAQALTVTNWGFSPLVISKLLMSGDYQANFSLQPAPNLPLTIAPFGKSSLNVQFAPRALGAQWDTRAMLEISSNDAEKPLVKIPLTGDAVPVRLSGFQAE